LAPAVVEVRLQLPAAIGLLHVAPVPSLTVTSPVGVPAPGLWTVTPNVTLYDSPTTVGVVSVEVIEVAVDA
jgi:hypothetical protein